MCMFVHICVRERGERESTGDSALGQHRSDTTSLSHILSVCPSVSCRSGLFLMAGSATSHTYEHQ